MDIASQNTATLPEELITQAANCAEVVEVAAAAADIAETAAPTIEAAAEAAAAPAAPAAEAPAPITPAPATPSPASTFAGGAPAAPTVAYNPATGQYVYVYPNGMAFPYAPAPGTPGTPGTPGAQGAQPAPGMPGMPFTPPAPPAPKVISRQTAAILALALLGIFGVHKFYTGNIKPAVITLLISVIGAVTIVAPATMFFIGVIEGITYLRMTDEEFRATYVEGKKAWF